MNKISEQKKRLEDVKKQRQRYKPKEILGGDNNGKLETQQHHK